MIPDCVHEVDVQEPAEEEVVLQRLGQKGFAAELPFFNSTENQRT